MNRAVAGILGREGDAGRVTGALRASHGFGNQGVQVVRAGPLELGATGEWDEHTRPLCVLDGVILNAEALASELALAPGAPPESVLRAGWRRWGEGVLARLRGEFVVLVWDEERAEGVLARDQLGVRPMFLHDGPRGLAFASDLPDLVRLLPATPAPDPAAVLHWILFTDLRGRTLYEGIRPLSGGSYLRLHGGGYEHRTYWRLERSDPLDGSREEIVEQFRATLLRATELRLGAPGETGIMLSGGLDSTSVAALGRALRPEDPLSGWSGTFPGEDRLDESAWIELVASELRLDGRRAVVRAQDGGMIAGALEYAQRWTLPLGWPNYYWEQPLFAEAAASGVRVLLDGEGGDQVFGARLATLARHFFRGRVPHAVRLARTLDGVGDEVPLRRLLPWLTRFVAKDALPHALHTAARRRRGPGHYSPDWFGPESAELAFASHDPLAWKQRSGPLWWRALSDHFEQQIDAMGLYDIVRRRTEASGLEARHPLLDVELVELCMRMPPELTFDHRMDRPVFREAMMGMLPDAVRLRRGKSEFSRYFNRCLDGPDRAAMTRLLADPAARVGEYVELGPMREGLLEHPPHEYVLGAQVWRDHVWRLAGLEIWLRELEEPGWAQCALEWPEVIQPEMSLVPQRSQSASTASPVLSWDES